MKQSAFKIHGMDRAEEVAAPKSEISPMPDVHDLAFDGLNGKMTVDYSESQINVADLSAAVANAGLREEPWSDAILEGQESTR